MIEKYVFEYKVDRIGIKVWKGFKSLILPLWSLYFLGIRIRCLFGHKWRMHPRMYRYCARCGKKGVE